MTSKHPIQIPAEALDELRMLERSDSSYRLDDLVLLVNSAALRFLPLTEENDGRIKGEFTARTLRHYQTLGCLHAPELDGRIAIYRFRHYLQALLIRKLLFEGFSSKQIKSIMLNRTGEGLLALLMQNVEVAKTRALDTDRNPAPHEPNFLSEQWTELKLDSEITLRIQGSHPALTEARYKELLHQALKAIQRRLE